MEGEGPQGKRETALLGGRNGRARALGVPTGIAHGYTRKARGETPPPSRARR